MANFSSIVGFLYHRNSRDRIVVSTLRCGRSNPGSNPGHGNGEVFLWIFQEHFISFTSYKHDLFHLWMQNWGQGIWQGLFNNTFFWKRLMVKSINIFTNLLKFHSPIETRCYRLPIIHQEWAGQSDGKSE